VTVTCPAGHESATDDYCDVCGVSLAPAAGAPPAAASPAGSATPGGRACANCGAPHEPGDVFCEVCGLDFATGELPQPPPPAQPLDEPEDDAVTPPGPDAAAKAEAPRAPAAPDAEANAEAPRAPATPDAEANAEAPRAPAQGDWYIEVEPDRDWFDRNEAEGTTGSVAFPEDTTPWQLMLTGEEVLVGRRSETRTAQPDLEIEDPGVSRRHALLRRQPDGSWVVVDEESTNGTWVDGAADAIAAGEPAPLSDGSTVHIGAFTRLTIRKA
jgi:hypothetical protein